MTVLLPWETVDFPHFVGVRHQGVWTNILLKPSGQEIDVTTLGGGRVVLHGTGIEFLPPLPSADAEASPGADAQVLCLPSRPPEGT